RRMPNAPDRRPAMRVLGHRIVWWALLVVWVVATTELFRTTAALIVQKITWYLAVDQYGYLTFAHDLLHGRVFHHWPPLDAFAARLPARVDVLVQTYVADHGRLYCRYPPGYPLLLAGWIGLLGDDAA